MAAYALVRASGATNLLFVSWVSVRPVRTVLAVAGTPVKRAKRVGAVATRKINQRTKRERKRNAELYGELMEMAAANNVRRPRGADAATIMQEIMERRLGDWRWATSQLDNVPAEEFWVHKIDAQGNVLVEPCKWYQLEQAASAELERITNMIVGAGLAERAVRVEEAKAAMLISALRDALESLKLTPEQRSLVGPTLRQIAARIADDENVVDAEVVA